MGGSPAATVVAVAGSSGLGVAGAEVERLRVEYQNDDEDDDDEDDDDDDCLVLRPMKMMTTTMTTTPLQQLVGL